MCEHCITYGDNDDDVYEVTQEDINLWKDNGKYFGYPKCCIEEFCNRETIDITPEQEQVIDNHGFIPCQKHAIMILENKTTLKDLINNRECQYVYPMDDEDAELMKFLIENDPEFQINA